MSMYLIVERIGDEHAWAPVELAADNPSAAFDEAEKRFKSWKSCRVSKLYHMDRDGNIKLIHDFAGEHPAFRGRGKAELAAGVEQFKAAHPELSDPWHGRKFQMPIPPAVVNARVCILTGAPGENEDDCTTHDHEDN